jgi:hypothetical protein
MFERGKESERGAGAPLRKLFPSLGRGLVSLSRTGGWWEIIGISRGCCEGGRVGKDNMEGDGGEVITC